MSGVAGQRRRSPGWRASSNSRTRSPQVSLELSSGSTYRMSGDAGSASFIDCCGDSESARSVSEANEAFRDQTVNIRALIRDAKSVSGSAGASNY